RDRGLGRGRVHALAVRGGDDRAGGLVDRGGAVHPVPGREDAARPVSARAHAAAARAAVPAAPGRPGARVTTPTLPRGRGRGAPGIRRGDGARALPDPFLPAVPAPAGLVAAPPLGGDRRHGGRVRAVAGTVPVRAAAVLPGVDPARTDGGHGTGRGQFAARNRGPG